MSNFKPSVSNRDANVIFANNSTAIIAGDLIIISLVCFLAIASTFHIYFFGDEIAVAHTAQKNNWSFTKTFLEISQYKPRLLFNAIEAWLFCDKFPRFAHAAITGVALSITCSLTYLISLKFLGASRMIGWLTVICILTSRFGVMLYYDYISGLIEYMASALLLGYFMCSWLAIYKFIKIKWAVYSSIIAILCVFTHERYFMAISSGSLLLIAVFIYEKNYNKFILIWLGFNASLPPLLFYIASKIFGASILVGTAGQHITVSTDIFKSAAIYVFNLIGGNYGNDWEWGGVNHTSAFGLFMATLNILIFFAWLGLASFKIKNSSQYIKISIFTIAIIIGLICAASLPGSFRQEARWLAPAFIFLLFPIICLSADSVRKAGLLALLVVNLVYLFSGSQNMNYHIVGSKQAEAIGAGLNNIIPSGRKGFVYGLSDSNWVIGNGDAFSNLNLGHGLKLSLYPIPDPLTYDFALFFTGYDKNRKALYLMESPQRALFLAGKLGIESLPIVQNLGNINNWNTWSWGIPPLIHTPSGICLKLDTKTDGWKLIDGANLAGKLLVYEAKSGSNIKASMRLQINWHNANNDSFIKADIKVVTLDNDFQYYSSMIYPPTSSSNARIYLSLHDDSPPESMALIRSVSIR